MLIISQLHTTGLRERMQRYKEQIGFLICKAYLCKTWKVIFANKT